MNELIDLYVVSEEQLENTVWKLNQLWVEIRLLYLKMVVKFQVVSHFNGEFLGEPFPKGDS